MPRKNLVREFEGGGYYHIYNRGVDKRDIFMDDQDYGVFLGYLKQYLSPDRKSVDDFAVDLSSQLDLIAFCLMPNHFHLLIKQNDREGITKLMHGLSMRYSVYFNRRHNRVGTLFQGPFRSVRVNGNEHLMHLSRYIHLNPQPIRRGYINYPYSSFKYYGAAKRADWVKPRDVLELFTDPNEYSEFTRGYIKDSKKVLSNLTLE